MKNWLIIIMIIVIPIGLNAQTYFSTKHPLIEAHYQDFVKEAKRHKLSKELQFRLKNVEIDIITSSNVERFFSETILKSPEILAGCNLELNHILIKDGFLLMDDLSQKKILDHELGHCVFNLGHDESNFNIMNDTLGDLPNNYREYLFNAANPPKKAISAIKAK